MKKILAGLFSMLFIMMTDLSMAQDATPTTGTTSTPVATAPQKGKSEVRERIHNQALRIAQGIKSGILSKDQAGSLKDKLKSISEQAKSFYLGNGKKPLTADQKTQINQQLDDNSKAIYQAKHPGQQPPSSTAPDDSNESN
ncbi:MAG TPA: hypothetical protein VK791_03350 [bacterium]|jgi:hypothetical protein|nr:hypothetical protein [bacterium]